MSSKGHGVTRMSLMLVNYTRQSL